MALPAVLKFLANPSFWSGAANATSAAGGLASLFGIGRQESGGGTINLEDFYPSWTKKTANTLSDWVQRYLPQYNPGEAYTGKLTASMTPFETTGLNILDKYLSSANTGELFGAGKQQILDTLGGKYADPNQSPFIKSMMNLSKLNLTDAINAVRARRGGRGTYYTEEGIREEGRTVEKSQANLDAIIGKFIDTERQNMLSAADKAATMDEYENVTAPLKKITASQTLGSLQRTIEQADLEAQYQEFVRQRGEMAKPLTVAPILMGGQWGTGGTMNAPVTTSNSTMSTLNSLSQLMNLLGGYFKKK